MSQSMKNWIPISLALFLSAGHLFGQAAPTATATLPDSPATTGALPSAPTAGTTAPRISWVDGTVHYSLSATEIVQYGYFGAGSTTSSTALSGLLGYASMSDVHPTMLLFASGVIFGQGGQGTQTYQNLAITQSLIKGHWMFNVADSFSFLPQSPVSGVAGVPGINNPGTSPNDGPSQGPAGGILTFTGNRVSNMVSGTVERTLTARNSISGSGSWSILHFLNKNAGLDTTTSSGQVALNHRFDARNSGSVSGVYSSFQTTNLSGIFPVGFPLDTVTYQTKGVNLSYSRQWTRSLSTVASGGPMWIQSSASALIPNRLNFYLTAGAIYSRRLTTYNVMYMHGINGGSGVLPGAISDSISGSVSHTITHQWAASASMVYTRSSGITTAIPGIGLTDGATTTEYGTLQVTRGFTRTISGYASYTAQNQTVPPGFFTTNIYSGLSHIFALGITWSPQATHLGDF
jgi:hypothetical protein